MLSRAWANIQAEGVNTINSKQRVQAALERKAVDRVPVYMWFHPATAVRIADLLEIPAAYLGQAMGNDIQQTWVNNNYGMEGIVHKKDGDSHIDFWGIKWVRQFFFNQIAIYPLETASRQEVLAYEFPYEQIDFLLELMEPVVAASADTFIGCDVSPCAYEMYWRLRGMENVLIETISDPEFAYIMLGRCVDFAIELSERACSRFPLNWLWTGDDVASQLSMMMSPTSWRTLIKPHLARVFAIGKKYNLWVAFHCCGALRPIIPDLIEIGMDVLNPVQGNCPGMDPLQLKAEFGDHLAFMGGLDTQDMLPNGSVVEVRRETDRLLAGMTSGGGGYIMAASHTISPETPDDNIFAMYEQVGIAKEEIFDRAAVIRKQLTLS